MNIKIHSSELNRMLKIVSQCIDSRFPNYSNIEITHSNNMLFLRGSNGTIQATMYTPVLGGDGEQFCVDGSMFAKVCSMCSGEVQIITDGKFCTIKGAGRTRIPLLNTDVPAQAQVAGKEFTVSAGNLAKCFAGVSYAISQDQSRIQLTGVLTEIGQYGMKMAALDGFQMSLEYAQCDGDEMKVIIPGTMMKLIVQGSIDGEEITVRTDGKRIQASTDSMVLACGALAGEFPDYNRILPTDFKTECKVNLNEFRDALKCGSVINTKQNLVKLEISSDSIRITNNSDEADYEATVKCETNGPDLKIAFNQKYLMNSIGALNTDDVILRFNSSVNPCIMQEKTEGVQAGIRLLLPVRTQG